MNDEDDNKKKYLIMDGKYYHYKELIGSGNFGNVYKGYDNNGEIVAIKKLKNPQRSNESKYQENEIDILLYLKEKDHPNIVKLLDYVKKTKEVTLIFEFCGDGNIGEFLKNQLGHRTNEKQAQKWMMQIASAFQMLRTNKMRILHRDIKPENLLLKKDKETGELNLKITDFGLSKSYNVDRSFDLKITNVGTPLYMAPEVIKGNATKKSDLWSIGCVLYEMIMGEPPYPAASYPELIEKLKFPVKFSPSTEKVFSKDCLNLIQRLLELEESKRIGWKEFFQHPFITGIPSVSQSSNNTINTNNTTQTKSSPSPPEVNLLAKKNSSEPFLVHRERPLILGIPPLKKVSPFKVSSSVNLTNDNPEREKTLDENYIKVLQAECDGYLIIGEISTIFERNYYNPEALVLSHKCVKLLSIFDKKLDNIYTENFQKKSDFKLKMNIFDTLSTLSKKVKYYLHEYKNKGRKVAFNIMEFDKNINEKRLKSAENILFQYATKLSIRGCDDEALLKFKNAFCLYENARMVFSVLSSTCENLEFKKMIDLEIIKLEERIQNLPSK